MEDGTLAIEDKSCNQMFKDLGLGIGKAMSTSIKKLPPFTMVGATTLLSLVSAPLRSRFSSVLYLQPYTLEEMRSIALRTAMQLSLTMSQDVAMEVALRSKGAARIAVSNVHWLRDYALAQGCRLTTKSARDAFSLKGIDGNGMTPTDLIYLQRLIASAEAVGIETLAAILGESSDTLEQTVEPFLLAQGFIEKTSRGRVATAKARSIYGVAA
jgi:Holliday junction DNA helicase RuvB